jgi:hypothetical protein
MSSTIKSQLSAIKAKLDLLFANANATERPEVIKDLRDYLSRTNSTSRAPAYDKHTNAASGI